MEAALRNDPDDHVAWQAYGDWLTEQGDARGEHILTSLAIEALRANGDPTDRQAQEQVTRLTQRLEELRRDHVWEWLGDLAPFLAKTPFQFRYGWLSSALVWNDAALIECLIRSRAAQFLEELTFRDFGRFLGDNRLMMKRLRQAPWLHRLHTFTADCEGDGHNMLRLVRQMPRLRRLTLSGPVNGQELFAASTLGKLEELSVHNLRSTPLAVLAANPVCTQLRRLAVWTDLWRGPSPADIWAVLRSPHFQLRELEVGPLGDGYEFCKQAARQGLPEQLARLIIRQTDTAAIQAFLELGRIVELEPLEDRHFRLK